MSASLVGSEMCIRDRLPSVSCVASLEVHAHRWRPIHVSGTAAREADSVSYTHLTLPTICSV
eukprot:9954892-Alexandrium_andersonii.AAC.1